jgi:hypothetical protein
MATLPAHRAQGDCEHLSVQENRRLDEYVDQQTRHMDWDHMWWGEARPHRVYWPFRNEVR